MEKRKKSEKVYIRITPRVLTMAVLLIWVLSLSGVWLVARQLPRKKNSSFSLLNPKLKDISADTPEARNAKLFATIVPLKQEILDSLGNSKDNVAFYVEDLNSGSWAGWKEREPFIGASLLKVPVAIGVMKKIDRGEWTLDTTFPLNSEYKDQNFGELWKVPDETPMTIRRLMEEMLQNSDNTAAELLFDKIPPLERDDIYYHIGISNPEDIANSVPGKQLFTKVSSKDLANMFRTLYNSTYLATSSSNYILDLLTQTKFDKLVSTSIPKNIKVAHKIGNYFNADPNRPKQYHDCGITYFPEHPYLYCVMTVTFDADLSQKLITETSGKIYSYFENNGEEK